MVGEELGEAHFAPGHQLLQCIGGGEAEIEGPNLEVLELEEVVSPAEIDELALPLVNGAMHEPLARFSMRLERAFVGYCVGLEIHLFPPALGE